MKSRAGQDAAAGGTVFVASRLVVDVETVLAPGAVAVSGGKVIAAGSPREVLRAIPAGFSRYDLPGAAIVPGLVNAHTHLQIPPLGAGSETPGRPPSFVDWILRVVTWKRGADPGEFARHLSAAAAESLACGVTSVGEIAGPDLSAYGSFPLRARVFAEGIGFLPEAEGEVFASVRAALDILAEHASRGQPLAPGVAPHTLYTVGPLLLARLGRLSSERSLPVALHLAESPAEMEFLRTGGGEIATHLYPAVGKDVSSFRGIGGTVPGYLRSAGLLREGLLLVHNVHLPPEEIETLRGGGARFVLCPRSNAALGNGAPDVTFFLDAGIPFALGTDSLGSVPDLSPWDEARAARALYRGRLAGEELCRRLFRAATEEGAAALGLPGGNLRPGSAADLAVVEGPGGPPREFFLRLIDRTAAGTVRLAAIGGTILHERR